MKVNLYERKERLQDCDRSQSNILNDYFIGMARKVSFSQVGSWKDKVGVSHACSFNLMRI
ncbi:hypothetical protein J6590_067118 [Homalodisca vitripennis]|nr:hypothetical protein J6590_067118 [Homalodisca vitripennis]